MAAWGKSEPDDYMMDFIPMNYGLDENDYNSSTLRYMKMGDVYNEYRRSEFETWIKKWLKLYIRVKHPNEVVLLAVAPGHEAFDCSSFMYSLVGEFISENPQLPVEDGRSLLVRYKTIQKQSGAGANRNESTHRKSIRINSSQSNVGKVVLILDDVWTSGYTLRVCEEKVRASNPKDVKVLAIGKTV